MVHWTIAKLAWDFSWPRLASVCLAVLVASIANPAAAEKRVALVIGNGAYTKVPQLPNPPHDAAAMADMLRKAGFQVVTSKTDLGVEAMRHELRDFSDEVRDARHRGCLLRGAPPPPPLPAPPAAARGETTAAVPQLPAPLPSPSRAVQDHFGAIAYSPSAVAHGYAIGFLANSIRSTL